MTVEPPAPDTPGLSRWATLSPDAKRQRILDVAGELFAREGVEFPMPDLAKAVGIGVASLYRQIGSKDDVLALLVIDRIERFTALYEEAMGAEDPFAALEAVVDEVQTTLAVDHIAKISLELALSDPDVQVMRQRAADALDQLVQAAVAAGQLRPDATAMDLRMALRAAREAERLKAGGGRRFVQLVFDGLRADRAVVGG